MFRADHHDLPRRARSVPHRADSPRRGSGPRTASAGGAYTSAGGPSWSTRPAAITPTRSDTASASSWSCVTITAVTPVWRWRERSSPRSWSRRCRSRFASGSSRRSTSGFDDEGTGQGDPLLLPAGERRRLAVALGGRRGPTRSSMSSTRRSRSASRHAADFEPEGDVLPGGEVREQGVVLEHRAGVPGSPAAARVTSRPRERSTGRRPA